MNLDPPIAGCLCHSTFCERATPAQPSGRPDGYLASWSTGRPWAHEVRRRSSRSCRLGHADARLPEL